jgi:hypothetical protein
MAKKAKAMRLTASRKAFLNMVEKLSKYFDDDGLFKQDEFYTDDLVDSILDLFDKLPPRLRNILDSSTLFGSALYVLQMPQAVRDVDSCSETCRGSVAFDAAFSAGWSMGFDAGKKDAEEESDEGAA